MPNEFVAKNGIIAQNNSIVSGSLIVTNGITGSLFGTSSQAVSASFTATASYGFFVVSASYAFTASSATNAFQAVSSSYANVSTNATSSLTASYVLPLSQSVIVTGSLSVTGSLFVSSSNQTQLQVGSNLLTVNSSGNIGIGASPISTYTLAVGKNLTNGATSYGIGQYGTVQSDTSASANGIINSLVTAATSFTLTNYRHFYANQSTIGAGSTVTNQAGFQVDPNMIGATNNYGFRGGIPAQANAWNLYMDGTANNYLAGSLGIGTTGLTNINLAMSKNISGSTTSYGIYSNGTIQSGVTTAAIYNVAFINTAAASFTVNAAYAYYASQGSIGASSAISQQHGFYVHSAMTGGTVNYAFRSTLPSGSGAWNLYMDGGAPNFLSGSLGVGKNPAVSSILDVSGSFTTITGSLSVSQGITGSSILSTGTITAQTLVVSTISSSVVYSSGSNIFGNSTSNTQTMTGSVNITGSLSVVGGSSITGSLTVATGSFTVITGSGIEFQVTATGTKIGNVLTDVHTVTGSFNITGSLTTFGLVTVQSASFDYAQNTNVVTGSFQVIASEPTSSYRAAFFDYVMFSGSVVRAGTVYSTWSGSATEYYENYTADLGGSTAGVQLQTAISGSNIQLQATASSQAWTIRSLVRLL